VRLDHLLSREIRVELVGVSSALMAPRLIVTIDIARSPGGRGREVDLGLPHGIDDDLAKHRYRSKRSSSELRPGRTSCHSSRVRVHSPGATVCRRCRHRQAGD
jgi:hypothetical protein